jgi:hypothetical protein
LKKTTTIIRELDKGIGARTTSKKTYQRWYRLLCASIVRNWRKQIRTNETKKKKENK